MIPQNNLKIVDIGPVIFQGRYKAKVLIKSYDKIENGKKLCGICGQLKPVKCFEKHYKKVSGEGLKKSCFDCIYNRKKLHMGFEVARIISKMEFVLAYGGKCVCCGITELDLLTLDHIGGKHETPRLSSCNESSAEYRKLKKLGWPKDKYRLLCMNCNFAVRFDRPCPHSKEYKDYEKKLEACIRKDFMRHKDYKELKNKLSNIK